MARCGEPDGPPSVDMPARLVSGLGISRDGERARLKSPVVGVRCHSAMSRNGVPL